MKESGIREQINDVERSVYQSARYNYKKTTAIEYNKFIEDLLREYRNTHRIKLNVNIKTL